jgi:hypothetical protein
LNPKPLFQWIAIPTPLYFFQVTWSGPKRFFDPLRLVLYFPGTSGHAASATTATAGPIGPIGPVGPVGPIGPRRCRHIIFSRLEELHPGPGKKDCLFLAIGIRSCCPFLICLFRAKGPFRLRG